MERPGVGDPGEELLAEAALVRLDRVPAELVDVVDRGDEAGEQLVRERARLEARADGLGRGGPHLVRAPALEDFGAPEREPEMRAEELVRRAEEHVDAERGDVDRPVRRVVHRVGPGERADGVRELRDAARVDERPDAFDASGNATTRVRSLELRLEIVEVERRVVAELDELHGEIEVVRELEPRRDVPVVVELRREDLVAGAELAADRARQREVERRHVLAEDDLVRRAPRNLAAASRAFATSASLRTLASNAPPRFAFDSRRYAAIASITESGVCVPPGPSNSAQSERKEENLARIAFTSRASAATTRGYPVGGGATAADRESSYACRRLEDRAEERAGEVRERPLDERRRGPLTRATSTWPAFGLGQRTCSTSWSRIVTASLPFAKNRVT